MLIKSASNTAKFLYTKRKRRLPLYLGQAYHSPISLCEIYANTYTSPRYNVALSSLFEVVVRPRNEPSDVVSLSKHDAKLQHFLKNPSYFVKKLQIF